MWTSTLFFSSLPAEIRREIYSYALAPEIYTYDGQELYHNFRITHSHDGCPDDDIRDDLKTFRRRCGGSVEALREALKTWDHDLPWVWRGPKKYHPGPYHLKNYYKNVGDGP